MEDYKIIQIIPINKKMYAVYEQDNELIESPIICLALLEYEDGGREVIPMDITDGDGIIDIIGEIKHIKIIS